MRSVLIVALLAACGDGLTVPDATTVAAPDSSIGLVRVRYRGSLPDGNQVFFQNADSSLVLATRTNGDGEANAYMAPGGFATLVGIRASTHFIFTWFDVQPGDELVLDRRAISNAFTQQQFLLSVPPDPSGANYSLFTACGSAAVDPERPAGVPVNLGGCEGKTDMLVRSSLGITGYHYFYTPDVVLETTGIILNGTYRAFETSQITAQRIPAGIYGLTTTQRLIDDGRQIYGESALAAEVVDGQASFAQEFPVPAQGTLMTSLDLSPVNNAASSRHVIQWGPATTTTSFDLGQIPLRKYTVPATYLAGSHAIHWGEDGFGQVADAAIVQFGWAHPETAENYQWQFITPRTADPTIRLPHLPLPELTPSEHDVIVHPTTLASLKVDGGYAGIRATLLGRWMPASDAAGSDIAWPADGPAGTVTYEDLIPRL